MHHEPNHRYVDSYREKHWIKLKLGIVANTIKSPQPGNEQERAINIFSVGEFQVGELPSRELTYPPEKAYLKMIFLFPRWDMLISRRVCDIKHGYLGVPLSQ